MWQPSARCPAGESLAQAARYLALHFHVAATNGVLLSASQQMHVLAASLEPRGPPSILPEEDGR